MTEPRKPINQGAKETVVDGGTIVAGANDTVADDGAAAPTAAQPIARDGADTQVHRAAADTRAVLSTKLSSRRCPDAHSSRELAERSPPSWDGARCKVAPRAATFLMC